MVISAEEYRHKIFGVIPSPSHQTIYCETDMAAATASPEPKGTLTPPGSSPLRAECDPTQDSSHGSTPPSPEAPPTPDSAHMVAEPTNHSAVRLQSTNDKAERHLLTNEEPLSGAKKRKPTKVHKVETECGSEGETEAGAGVGSFACPVCQEVLPSQHDFTQHIRKHNHVLEGDNGAKVYCCGICQKQLSSNSSLDRHMLVHSGERPFRCHICGTHFTTNGNMHRHIRGHLRNGGGGGGGGASSDTGESDMGSEEAPGSPYKRPHDDDDSGAAPPKQMRLEAEEELACPACGIEQPSQHALEQHVETMHPEYQVSCSSCQLGFKNYRALHLHNSMVHPATAPPHLHLTVTDFSTSKFPLIAKEVCEASSRKESVAGESVGSHRCQICRITFPCADSWLMHMREHTASSPAPLRCTRCDLDFSSIAELSRHHQRHLCEESQPRKESFLAVLDLLNKKSRAASFTPLGVHGHEGLLAGSLRPPLGLPPPGQHSPAPADSAKASPEHPTPGRIAGPSVVPGSSGQQLLAAGQLLSHDEQFARGYRDMKLNGQYPCRLCKEIFANLRKLKSHNLAHMVAPPYRCNLCSFFSNDKNTLKEHMKSHKGDTPYECTLCNLAFTTKANCERHIKNIHGRQSRDEIKSCMNFNPSEECGSSDASLDTVCHVCHIDCKARSVLRDHMRSSHPEGVTKPFSCKLCGGTFISENDVMRHVIQQHSEAASGPTLGSLVETRPQDQDLTPVESLLNFSKLHMPVPLTPHPPPPQQPLPLTFSPKPPMPMPVIVPHRPLTPAMPPMPLETEDAPLDLSMNSKRDVERDKGRVEEEVEEDEEEEEEEEEEVDVEVTEVKVEQEQPEDLSKPRRECGDEDAPERSPKSSPECAADVLKIPRPPFPLGVYPQPLSGLCSPFPPAQYPIFMSQYRMGHQFDAALLEEYQKELKRGLHLTSGGGLLGGGTPILPHSSSFPLSALAVAAAKSLPLRIPRPELRGTEDRGEEPPTAPEAPVSAPPPPPPPKPSEEDVMHFTMRNSVLMKKPKQRRYRTERPWRCDLCDKGFTLRSNMERHMKQQHPDVWQKRPRGGDSTSRSEGEAAAAPREVPHISSAVREQLIIKIEKEASDEKEEPRLKEEEEKDLIIDDDAEDEGEEEEEEGEEDEEEEEEVVMEEETGEEKYQENSCTSNEERGREDGGADLASVHKLLSTASSQSFPFFSSEGEDDGPNEDDSTSSASLSEEGKRSAYSSAPQKQKCPFCQRKFPWSSSLVRHIRTHTGQKPYLCPVCHFPFTTKSNCDRHLLRKHPDSPHTTGGDRPYRCSKCPGAAFTNIESLRKHEMFKHEKASDTAIPRDDSRPFRCHVCEAPLATREAAMLHLSKSHPEHAQNAINTDPITPENNNEPLSAADTTITTEKVSCMFCLQRYWSLAELKQHITEHHTRPITPVPIVKEEKPAYVPSAQPSKDVKEERKEETEGSDFISDLLGTKRAVVDHLLTSKSADDAAKLLGVR